MSQIKSKKSRTSAVIKRKNTRLQGLFVDGVLLDRASRRLGKRVDFSRLLVALTNGQRPIVARYYTVVPYEDDSRHRSFLEAVSRAGFSVVVKRLPPKGIERQVTTDIEIASDIIAFTLGTLPGSLAGIPGGEANKEGGSDSDETSKDELARPKDEDFTRNVTVLCPSRDLIYPLELATSLGADTTAADFGTPKSGELLGSARKWTDLSDTVHIWITDDQMDGRSS